MPHWLFVSCLLFSKSNRSAQPNLRSFTLILHLQFEGWAPVANPPARVLDGQKQ